MNWRIILKDIFCRCPVLLAFLTLASAWAGPCDSPFESAWFYADGRGHFLHMPTSEGGEQEGFWLEIHRDQKVFRLKEISRTQDSVELYDNHRQITVRLKSKMSHIKGPFESDFRILAEGDWDARTEFKLQGSPEAPRVFRLQENYTWVEHGPQATERVEYQEISRDPHRVLLFNMQKDLYVLLTGQRVFYKTNQAREWSRSADGQWPDPSLERKELCRLKNLKNKRNT